MSKAVFKAYIALLDVKPIDKIIMQQKYNFPRKAKFKVFLEICTRCEPPSVEEGKKIGVETLALIA
jgi:hypothetical protein